jgi:hypothetical protein
MSQKFSFTKYEQELLPEFRAKISRAESTEDVKKFFVYTVQELFGKVFQGKVNVEFEDVRLDPLTKPYFGISDVILESKDVKSAWIHSDLPHVLERLAEPAMRRYNHLKKKPTKTETKIRM